MTQRKPKPIPTTPSVLRWARLYRGLSIAQAANELRIGQSDLRALEQGDIKPDASMLRKMSQVYRQVDSVLLLSEPPATTNLPTDFRTVGGVTADLSEATIWAIREAQQLQRFISELTEDDDEIITIPNIPHKTTSDDAEVVASKERARFQVTLEHQLKWPTQETFGRWRFRMQTKGILVLIKRMPREDCRGVSLTGEGLIPTIVVNAVDVETAKTFTLFHEYAHLMLGSAGVCIRGEDNTDRGLVEKWCNQFAAAFLIPADSLRDVARTKFNVTGLTDWHLNDVRKLAVRFKVSRPAMALRLQELGLAPANFYDKNKQLLNHSEQSPERKAEVKSLKRPPGWRARQTFNEIGFSAAEAIIGAYRNQVTDITEAADALGLSLEDLFGLEDRVEVERVRNAGL